ncbi:MAG: Fic family protein [Propionibacteriaceae bacterium]|nr:Fic family protein [Propionibacteriaceae bacterium]MCL1841829.1 Fic family protein [Propionibacteriaceae bacterium]
MTYQPFPAFRDWPVDFDPSVVDAYAEQLLRAKAIATPEALNAALSVALRSAAVETGAIEGLYTSDRGFTRTVATQAAAWELLADERGPNVRRSINDQIAGYEYVLDAVTRQRLPEITENWIRELHTTICASKDTYRVFLESPRGWQDQPLPKGEYKHFPNNPTNLATNEIHEYAPVLDTPEEMRRLLEQLSTPEFEAAHPVIQAAYAHYAFICVHPFADGNGRVSRALASVFLYRNPGVPLVVFSDQRDSYLDALGDADKGNPHPFVHFIEQRVIDTVNLVARALTTDVTHDNPDVAGISSVVASLNQPLLLAGERLVQVCLPRLRAAIDALHLPSQIRMTITGPHSHSASVKIPPSYTQLPEGGIWIRAKFRSTDQWVRSEVVMADGPEMTPQLLIIPDDDAEPLAVRRSDIDPTETMYLDALLAQWAAGEANRLAHRLNEALTQQGHA